MRFLLKPNFAMSKILPSLLLSAFVTLSAGQAFAVETYSIDPVHSSVGFKVKHLFSFVEGRFNDIHGTITGDPAKPESGQVSVEIKAASIDTHEPKRDAHLRSPDFFDADKFPALTFTSKSVKLTGKDTADVTGDLTMHGVTKEVVLKTQFVGKGPGQDKKIHTGWEAKTDLKRSDYGLTWSKLVEGTQVVGDAISIDLQIDAVQTDASAGAPAAGAPATPPAVVPAAPGTNPPFPAPPAGAPTTPPVPGAPK